MSETADPQPTPTAEAGAADAPDTTVMADMLAVLDRGGVVIWIIGGLSVVTVALILWKLWRFGLTGLWRRARAERATALWLEDRRDEALATAAAGRGIAARVLATTLDALHVRRYAPDLAGAEASRAAKAALSRAGSGLRALEVIATVAPLLGLFGTVLGMIAAFQALQQTGARADPAALAGGIWEALLTTAAGMALAIPASIALAWFEGVIEGLRQDMEDMVTRVLTHAAHGDGQGRAADPARAAE